MQFDPNADYTVWLTDAAAAAQQVTDGLDWSAGGWLIAGLAVIGIARRFAPLLGPAGGVVTGLIDSIAGKFLPKEHREAKARQQVMEESAWKIVELIEECGTDDPVVKQLKKKISEHTPAEFNAIFDAWKKEQQGI